MREVAQTLTSVLALDQVTTLILDQLKRVVPYDSASLMLREGDMMRITATRGFGEQVRERLSAFSFRLSDDADMSRIVETRQPLVLADAQPARLRADRRHRACARLDRSAPLLIDDEVIGILNVDSARPGAYTEEDGQMAFALASLAAQSIHNGRLFAECAPDRGRARAARDRAHRRAGRGQQPAFGRERAPAGRACDHARAFRRALSLKPR